MSDSDSDVVEVLETAGAARVLGHDVPPGAGDSAGMGAGAGVGVGVGVGADHGGRGQYNKDKDKDKDGAGADAGAGAGGAGAGAGADAGAVSEGTVHIRYRGVYTGMLLNGIPHGYGVFTNKNGDVFKGSWEGGKRHGHVHVLYANGEEYEGEFRGDRRCGKGLHSYVDGSTYEGEFKNDLRHGPGVYTTTHEYYNCEKMWVRSYENGVLTDEREAYTKYQMLTETPGFGFGVWVNEEGIRYEGEHEHGQKHGMGILTFPDGTQWVGPFENGVRHGIGMRKTLKNEYFFDTYREGVLEQSTVSDYANWKNVYWFDEGGSSIN